MKLADFLRENTETLPDIHFDVGRTDVYDVVDKILPVLVMMGYQEMLRAEVEHNRIYDVQEDGAYPFTIDELRDKVEDIISQVQERLGNKTHGNSLTHDIKLCLPYMSRKPS